MPSSNLAIALTSSAPAVFTNKALPAGVDDNTVLVQVDTTASNVSFNVQGSLDNTNWTNLTVVPLATGVPSASAQAPGNSTVNIYKLVNCVYIPYIRVSCTTGTANVSFVSFTEDSPAVIYTTASTATSTFSGAAQFSSTSANALTVGPSGTTNPSFNVDASTGSAVNGLNVKSSASGNGVALSIVSSSGNEPLTIDSKGTGTITIAGTSTGGITLGQTVTMADAKNVILNATTGTKIGTATTQKLGFYNATPVVQPPANTDTSTGAAGSTTSVFLNTTFTGAGTAAYTIGGIVASLKALGFLAT